MTSGSAHLEARWQKLAQHRGWGAWALLPIAALYGLASGFRRWMYRSGRWTSHRLPVPVVVVGNVVVGGAGKTPTTIAVVKHLQSAGWSPGVVSRGHGRASKTTLAVTHETPASESGDEPRLIAAATGVPVCVSRDRVAAARSLLSRQPGIDIVVCDDGLQHLAMQRDVVVVVFDDRGLGNGWLLPAGLLREPWPPRESSQPPTVILRQFRDDGIAHEVPALPDVPAFNARRRLAHRAVDLQGHTVDLGALKGTPLVAVAGIARPEVFFDMLRQRGLTLSREVGLADHADLAQYLPLLQDGPQTFICTEKDATKLTGLTLPQSVKVWSVALELDIDAGFFAALDARLPPLPAKQQAT